MKLCSEDSKSSLILGIAIQSLFILFMIAMEIKMIRANVHGIMYDIFFFGISGLIIYAINKFIILDKSSNYELLLEEECFTYRTFFTEYTKQYNQVKLMKIAREIVKTGLGEYNYVYLLKIKLKGINKIYISLDSITDTQYEELKKFLLNKTGITIKEIN